MNRLPKISVVVPVYNTGKFFENCIEAIRLQSYKLFELICINDCSSDPETINVLKFYEKADERIRGIWLDRKSGAAQARNLGIGLARGDYIIFLDSDDTFEPEFFESMLFSLEKASADVCICAHRKCYVNGAIKVVNPVTLTGVTDRVFKLDELGEKGLTYWWDVPWNKIYKRNFILDHNLRFQSIKSFNDAYFACASVLCAEKIVYVNTPKPLVNYRAERLGQISSQRDILDSYRFLGKLMDDYWERINNINKAQILYRLIEDNIFYIKTSADRRAAKVLYDKIQIILRRLGNSIGHIDLSPKVKQHAYCWRGKRFEDNWIGG